MPGRDAVHRLRRSRPGAVATDAAKSALRAVGMVTASVRSPPDYLVIGAKRGGTTSLHAYLAEHPGVLPLFPRPQKIKGTYFFTDEWPRGPRWYRSHFPTTITRRRAARHLGYDPVAGDSSPYYLFHPLAPARAASMVPEARVIALLRDPAERAFSHYNERRSNGTEPLDFEDAVEAEGERCAGEEERILADPTYVSFAHRHQSYLGQSRYALPVRRWLDAFPNGRVLVLPAEELYRDPQGTYDRICGHLGLPEHTLRDPRVHNAVPSAALDPSTRARVRAALADDVGDLERLLGRPMGWSLD